MKLLEDLVLKQQSLKLKRKSSVSTLEESTTNTNKIDPIRLIHIK